MGSEEKEAFHKADESPVHNVTVSPFFMAEVEVTWDQYWAFYGNTMSEGRTTPETVYANNSNPNVDAISGPTPQEVNTPTVLPVPIAPSAPARAELFRNDLLLMLFSFFMILFF